MNIPTELQLLEYEDKVLRDDGAGKDSTIILNLRMRGGSIAFKNSNTIPTNHNGSISRTHSRRSIEWNNFKFFQ